MNTAVHRHWRWVALALLAGVCGAVAVIALGIVEGPGDFAHDVRHVMTQAVLRLGPGASFVGLYLEESGVPLPVPGDALVLYLGHHFASSPPALIGVWCGLEVAVVAGATNLYLLARHFGRRLLEGWVGALLHLTPERLARVERWSRRWGPLAIIFGRHIFGLRPAVTVASGILRIPYPVFALSTAISTAPWAAILLWIGVHYGHRIGHFLNLHGWAYVMIPLLAVGGLVAAAAHGRHVQRKDRSVESSSNRSAERDSDSG
ncbi:MAG: DedA family protein [Candidatus Dormibacteraceae bacterium]